MIQADIHAFEMAHDNIKVIAKGDLTLDDMVEDIKSTFLLAWEDRKFQITKQAKQHLLQKIIDEVTFQLQSLNSVKSVSEAKRLKNELENNILPDFNRRLMKLSDDSLPDYEKAKEAIKTLHDNVKELNAKLDLSHEFFELVQTMVNIIGESNQALQKQIDSNISEEGCNDRKAVIEIIVKALNDAFSEGIARLSSLGQSLCPIVSLEPIEILRRDHAMTLGKTIS